MSTGYSGSGQSSKVVVPSGSKEAPPVFAAHQEVERPNFDAVYDEHFPFVWRVVRRQGVPEGALDDVVQDVFLVVHRRLSDYDGCRPIRGWLFGIALRIVADHRRRFRRKDAKNVPHDVDRDGAELLASTSPLPSAEAEHAEALRLATMLLEQIEPAKREILLLSQVDEMSIPEIADCLGINQNTAYARLRAAKREFDAAYARHRARTERRPP